MDNSSTNDQDEICRSKSANYCISMFEKIRDFQQRKMFCDITVNVRGENYFAHRVVLAAASQHFADVLDGEESLPVVVDFNDMSSEVFEKLLEYVYSGNSNLITSKNVEDLFEASKILRIGSLEAACSGALVITTSNWYKIKVIAGEHHRSEEVYEKCLAYALQNFTEIAATDAYLELPLDQVKDFVADGRVVISAEEEMFSAVLKWVKHDLENRKQHLFEVMKNVKFPLMDKTFFLKTVMAEPLLRADLDCVNLLLEATSFHAGIQPSVASQRLVPREHLKKKLVSYIFATGGMSGDVLSECEVYNPRTNTWSPIASMQSKREYHAVAGYGQLLYAFGGLADDTKLSTVEYYDPTKDSWAWGTPMPYGRFGHAVCNLNGSIFIGGGRDGQGEYVNTVEQFDPSTGLYKTCAAMNSERAFFKMAATGDCIYAIGGGLGFARLNAVERFDPREGRWSAAPSISKKRGLMGVTVLNGYIYCAGGDYDGNKPTGERFDIRRNTWEPIPNMLSERDGHELVALDGCVFAIGGRGMTSVEKFDPDTNRWVEMPSMLHARYNLGATALDCVEINHP